MARDLTEKRLRVLILKERGTPQRMWDEVIPLLTAGGVEPIVGSVFGAEGLQDQIRGLGSSSFSLACRSAADYPRRAVALARIVRDRNIDVVHGTEPIPACVGGAAGRIARRGLRVFHRQHLAFESRKLTGLSYAAAHLNDVVLACSKASADYAVRLDRVSPSRTMVAYNGANELRPIAPEEAHQMRTSLRIGEGAHVVVSIARLDPVKGLDVLLDALPDLQRRIDAAVHVVLVGEGRERSALSAQAERLGIAQRVHLVGHQADVAPWIGIADVVAMPSRREAFGVAAAEAMSCGKPLVVARVGGLPEVVEDGLTGFIVEPESAADLAAGLGRILGDRGLAQSMGDAARRRFLALFTNRQMVQQWLRCYRTAAPGSA
jgi:glycosyltransferase involved in cell wall biosynthesis